MRRHILALVMAVALIPFTPSPAAAQADAPQALRGTAWGDGEVYVDSTVSASQVQAMLRTGVRVTRMPGQLRVLIAGGQAIYTGSARCSLGANVRQGSTYFFVTAGHCTNAGATWYGNATRTTVLGTRTGTSFPGNDYGIVRYTNTSVPHPSAVHTYPGTLNIVGPGSPVVGQTVCRSGSTTGVRCGQITGLNQTVNYAQGTVYGLIRTNICAEPGDSGGPLYVPSTGRILGILSGGSGNCTTGGTTFYQPINEILATYGVTIP
ncbi:S1 family peptidase [Allorhizocola rhizosphaerae]|uniref:S1 family peptidase n=1 Tax=Allorhizocola rhizosphaerae TaxID=1872709 RepID=UPI000E3DD6BA|nr:S1 family peptidase [Allorhizocola rhizosphaerae]